MAVIAAASVALAGCASSDRQPLGSPTTWAVVLAQDYGVTMHARVIDAAGVVSNVRALPTMSALTVEEWKSLGQTRAVVRPVPSGSGFLVRWDFDDRKVDQTVTIRRLGESGLEVLV